MIVEVPHREAPNHNAACLAELPVSRGLTFFRHNLAFYREKRIASIGYDRARRQETRSTI
jgi:hypothetical protein